MPKGKGGTSPHERLRSMFSTVNSGLAVGRKPLTGKSRNIGLNKGGNSSNGSLPIFYLLDGV